MMYRLLHIFLKRRKGVVVRSNRIKAFFLFCCLFWYAASGYLYFELPVKPDLAWKDALWWAFVTMTTVGYGDYFPVTAGGRYLVGIPVMVFGIGFLGFIISEVAALLIETRSRRLKGMMEIKSKNHVLIININRVEEVIRLVKELRSDATSGGRDICLIDELCEELPVELVHLDLLFVRGNPTQETVLTKANLEKADYAIVLSRDPQDPESDDLNLAVTLVIESINPDIFSIVEIVDSRKARQFEFAGANSIICVSDLTSNLIIQELQDPGIKDVVTELTTNSYGEQLYLVPVNGEGRFYRDLVLYGLEKGITFLGIVTDSGVSLNCTAETKIAPGDRAVAIAGSRPGTVSL